jgi:DNA polymerase III subunit gamma/tau
MRHVSLYRKWRPRTFEAVVGQDPVVRTLRRAIETDRVAHAYLFSGPRGTGKTSTAKVLGMGLNCAKGPTSEPDGTCESCRAIINNSSLDVLEMDAASNRGIDEVRDLRDRVNLAPVQGRMKVYIIDEVHMLTTEAFNALLKMLEEPPEHVVFVLATTEKHKVLPTIISRCQSFDFRRPGVALLTEKLREIAEAEGIEVEPAALTLIAREGRGSFRDAEGLLDQLASFADGPITARRVRELLGSVGSEVPLETTDALYERRAADALRIVDRLQNEGKDLSRFIGELVAHLRRLMLLPHAPEVALAEVGAEERGTLEEQAGRIPTAEVVRTIEALGDTLSRARRGGDPKLELELTFLKLARDYEEPQVDALLRRLETLEQAVANGAATLPAPLGAEDAGPEEASEQRSAPKAPEAAQEEGGEPADEGGGASEEFALDWDSVMHELRGRRQVPAAAFYENARIVRYEDGVLEVVFPKSMETLVGFAGDPKHMKPLQEVLEERLGTRPRIEFGVDDAGGRDGASGGSANASTARVGQGARARDVPGSRPEAGAISGPQTEPAEGESQTVAGLEPPRRTPDGGEAAGKNDASTGPEPDASSSSEGPDDVIQDPQEVFAMAREWFDPGGDFSTGNPGR